MGVAPEATQAAALENAAFDAIYALRRLTDDGNRSAAVACEVACIAVEWLTNEATGAHSDEDVVRLNLCYFAAAGLTHGREAKFAYPETRAVQTAVTGGAS